MTNTIRLGTSVLVLPYRGVAATAKSLATIDWLSDGRLIAGVGAGWLRPEFEALGVPFEARGRLTDEAIGGLRELFAGRGELTSIPARATIPIIVGGSSRRGAEARRAARRRMAPAQPRRRGAGRGDRELPRGLRRARRRVFARLFPPGLEPGPERDVLMGDDPAATRELLETMRAAGVDELVISWHDEEADLREVLHRWERFAL